MTEVEEVGAFLRERRPFIVADSFSTAMWVAEHLNLGREHWRYVGSAWSLRGTRGEIVLMVANWRRGCATTHEAQDIEASIGLRGACGVPVPNPDEYLLNGPGWWLERVVEGLMVLAPSDQEA
jgi:hypothetical protein